MAEVVKSNNNNNEEKEDMEIRSSLFKKSNSLSFSISNILSKKAVEDRVIEATDYPDEDEDVNVDGDDDDEELEADDEMLTAQGPLHREQLGIHDQARSVIKVPAQRPFSGGKNSRKLTIFRNSIFFHPAYVSPTSSSAASTTASSLDATSSWLYRPFALSSPAVAAAAAASAAFQHHLGLPSQGLLASKFGGKPLKKVFKIQFCTCCNSHHLRSGLTHLSGSPNASPHRSSLPKSDATQEEKASDLVFPDPDLRVGKTISQTKVPGIHRASSHGQESQDDRCSGQDLVSEPTNKVAVSKGQGSRQPRFSHRLHTVAVTELASMINVGSLIQ